MAALEASLAAVKDAGGAERQDGKTDVGRRTARRRRQRLQEVEVEGRRPARLSSVVHLEPHPRARAVVDAPAVRQLRDEHEPPARGAQRVGRRRAELEPAAGVVDLDAQRAARRARRRAARPRRPAWRTALVTSSETSSRTSRMPLRAHAGRRSGPARRAPAPARGGARELDVEGHAAARRRRRRGRPRTSSWSRHPGDREHALNGVRPAHERERAARAATAGARASAHRRAARWSP